MGFKKKNKRKEHCYDLSIDNESHMYLLANGLVTHNTFMLCVIAAEICLRNPNQVVKFVCPKQNQIERIIKPIMRVIFEDCPNDLEYDFKTQEKKFFFPHNNSEIQLAGTDKGNAESIRGGYSNWWFIDEAGFCDDLDYVVNSILAPTADTTNGRGILASTPSKEPDHEFIQKFMKPAFEKNKLIKFTIHDNPMLSEKDIQKIIARYPLGEKEPQFRREYLCHVIIDEERAVFPEFTEELESKIIREWKRPPFYDAYTAMDVGFDDLTVVLFAYYDFANGVTVIEDEFVINGPTMTTAKLADEIRKRENYIWTDPITGETNPVYLRISDNDKRLINDLQQLHDLTFVATDKDNKEMAVNNVRLKLAEEQIIINPRCEKLISHMRSATWNKNRKEFDRNYADKSHYDAADACVYLMRGVQTFKNPYPPGWSLEINQDTFLPPSYKQKQKELEGFSQLFLPKSSIKRKKK